MGLKAGDRRGAAGGAQAVANAHLAGGLCKVQGGRVAVLFNRATTDIQCLVTKHLVRIGINIGVTGFEDIVGRVILVVDTQPAG